MEENFLELVKYPEVESMEEANILINKGTYFAKKGLLVTGWALTQIRDKELFKGWDFDNFTEYLNSSKFEYSHTQAYRWIDAYEKFKSVDMKLLDQVGIQKLLFISSVKDRDERSELLERSPGLSTAEVKTEAKDFIKKDMEKFSNDVHRRSQREDEDLLTSNDDALSKCKRQGVQIYTDLDWFRLPSIDMKSRVENWFVFASKFDDPELITQRDSMLKLQTQIFNT